MSTAPQLNYEAGDKARLRRILLRMLLVLGVLAVIYGTYQIGTLVWRSWQIRKAEQLQQSLLNQCLNHSFAPGTIVFDDRPDARTRLTGMPYRVRDPRLTYAVQICPPVLEQYIAADRWLASMRPRAYPFAGTALRIGEPSILVHERRQPNGTPRLIYANVQSNPSYTSTIIFFWVRDPSPPHNPVTDGQWVVLPTGDRSTPDYAPHVIYAPTFDTQDLTHFVIPMQIGQDTTDIHCYLRDDGMIKLRCSFGWMLQEQTQMKSASLRLIDPASSTGLPAKSIHHGLD